MYRECAKKPIWRPFFYFCLTRCRMQSEIYGMLLKDLDNIAVDRCYILRRTHYLRVVNPLSSNPTKWSNTLKQLFGNYLTICLSFFDHFVKLALKLLMKELPLNWVDNSNLDCYEQNKQPPEVFCKKRCS